MSKRSAALAACGIVALSGVVAAPLSTAGASGDGTVVIYSGRQENLIQPLFDQFSEETGIDVQVRYGDTSDLALLIEEEGDQAPADVFISQSPGAIGYLDQRDLLATIPDELLELVPEEFRASGGSWVGTSGRQRVLAFNPDIVTEDELPDSILDLTAPEWEGRVGVAPTNASFQDFVSAMRIELGDEATEEWLEDLADNDPVTFANNGAVVTAVGSGEVDVGLVNHYYVYRAIDEDPDFPGRNHLFAPGDIGSLVIVSGASIIAGSEHPDEAQSLIEFLLGEQAQRYFSDETFEYPLANDSEPNEALPEVDLTAASDIHIDFDDLGADLGSTRAMIRDAGLED